MGGNFDVFDASQLDRQNLTHHFFKIITVFTGAWCKIVTIRQNIFRQRLEKSVSVKNFPHQNFALYGNCFST